MIKSTEMYVEHKLGSKKNIEQSIALSLASSLHTIQCPDDTVLDSCWPCQAQAIQELSLLEKGEIF